MAPGLQTGPTPKKSDSQLLSVDSQSALSSQLSNPIILYLFYNVVLLQMRIVSTVFIPDQFTFYGFSLKISIFLSFI